MTGKFGLDNYVATAFVSSTGNGKANIVVLGLLLGGMHGASRYLADPMVQFAF